MKLRVWFYEQTSIRWFRRKKSWTLIRQMTRWYCRLRPMLPRTRNWLAAQVLSRALFHRLGTGSPGQQFWLGQVKSHCVIPVFWTSFYVLICTFIAVLFAVNSILTGSGYNWNFTGCQWFITLHVASVVLYGIYAAVCVWNSLWVIWFSKRLEHFF